MRKSEIEHLASLGIESRVDFVKHPLFKHLYGIPRLIELCAELLLYITFPRLEAVVSKTGFPVIPQEAKSLVESIHQLCDRAHRAGLPPLA